LAATDSGQAIDAESRRRSVGGMHDDVYCYCNVVPVPT